MSLVQIQPLPPKLLNKKIISTMSKPERDALDEFIHTIPVNIERLIKSQGIKLNTNARPEDFTLNKKPKTEYYKDSLGQKIFEITTDMILNEKN